MPNRVQRDVTPKPQGSLFSALMAFVAVAVIAGIMVTVSVVPAIALTSNTASQGIGLFEDLPSDLTIVPLDQKTEIYAKSGGKNKLIASFYTQNREVVGWSSITQIVKDATLAGEDIRYYEHGGVDPTGIVRAAVSDLAGSEIQGASTITQQYVKNVCVQEAEQLSTEKKVLAAYNECVSPSIGRKLREMRLAIGLEKKYSKDQILLAYLNIVGFGGRIYGIQSAAEYYYGVPATKLTVAQAASLIAIVNNPSSLRLDLKENIAPNTERRDYILKSELTNKLITQDEYTTAVKTTTKPKITPTVTGCNAAGVAGFFCSYVVSTILTNKVFGKDVTTRKNNLNGAGWKIYTTLNLDLEKSAQTTMNTYVPMKSDELQIGGAAVSVEVGTGRIVTMVQNKIFNEDGDAASLGAQYTALNYNVDEVYGGSSGTQPGSTYKLFTLLDWLKDGHSLLETVDGSPRTIAGSDFTRCGKTYNGYGWTFGNDENESGSYSVLSGTERSINGVFGTMATEGDLCEIRELATASGVTNAAGGTLVDSPASVIGQASSVSPLSMATAYAGIANNGSACTAIAIDSITTSTGKAVTVPKTKCTQVVDQQVAIAAAYALHGVITSGTAAGDQTADGIYEMGKTGTTDGNLGTWMIGTTSKVSTAVWVGNLQIANAVDLRTIYDFPYCSQYGNGQAAIERHCLWKGIQTAVNKVYGGATTWAQPESQYLYGGSSTTTTPSTETGTVPNVVGLSEAAAESALVSAGYKWATGSSVKSSKAAGTIVSQSPAAGATAAAHTEVTITPSSG